MSEKVQSERDQGARGNGGPVASAGATYPMANLRGEIDRVFDRFMSGGWPMLGGQLGSLADWDPFKTMGSAAPLAGPVVRADVTETDKAYEISMELPGMDEKDIDVNVNDDIVTIRGEKKAEKETKEKDYHLTERSYGGFRREFRVPASVDQDKLDASFAKGVLTLVMPKTEEAQRQPRKINVKAN